MASAIFASKKARFLADPAIRSQVEALHVPNVFFVRGALSRQLAESANRWTEHLHSTHTHVLGRPLWSDQVGFTLAVAEQWPSPGIVDARKGVYDTTIS